VNGPGDRQEHGCADVDCAEVLDELQRFLDGEVGPGRVASMREHLETCFPCTHRAEFERHFRSLVRARCSDELAPPGLLDRVLACLDEAGTTGY